MKKRVGLLRIIAVWVTAFPFIAKAQDNYNTITLQNPSTFLGAGGIDRYIYKNPFHKEEAPTRLISLNTHRDATKRITEEQLDIRVAIIPGVGTTVFNEVLYNQLDVAQVLRKPSGSTAFVATGENVITIGNCKPFNNKRLTVNGGIITTGFVCTKTGWADYVFEPEYKLKALNEVEAFIINNRHLPDVPSQQEIEKNGMDMGPIMKLQMQKIEELTLYTIAQQKKIETLKKKLAMLNNTADR